MSAQVEVIRSPKFFENSLLVAAGLLALAPLDYQLSRWSNGLDPTFVHPFWLEQGSFPLFFNMAAVHPLIWISIAVLIFARSCRNYGWKLSR
jgi:hypothetical protein